MTNSVLGTINFVAPLPSTQLAELTNQSEKHLAASGVEINLRSDGDLLGDDGSDSGIKDDDTDDKKIKEKEPQEREEMLPEKEPAAVDENLVVEGPRDGALEIAAVVRETEFKIDAWEKQMKSATDLLNSVKPVISCFEAQCVELNISFVELKSACVAAKRSSEGIIETMGYRREVAPGWTLHSDKKSGHSFYHHEASGRSSWVKPPGSVDDVEIWNAPLRMTKWTSEGIIKAMGYRREVAPGWTRHSDKKTGKSYYHHAASGKTTWVKPPGCIDDVKNAPLRKYKFTSNAKLVSNQEKEISALRDENAKLRNLLKRTKASKLCVLLKRKAPFSDKGNLV